MPTYEYACTACGHRLEAVQKFSDDALTVCPECKGDLRKVYAAVGIVLKGSGFYKTDSRANGNGKKASQGAGSSSGESSGDGGSKSDTSSSPAPDSGSKSDAGSKTDSSKPAAATAS